MPFPPERTDAMRFFLICCGAILLFVLAAAFLLNRWLPDTNPLV